MRSTGNYFDEVIAFERGKSEKGLFMSEKLADAVIEQCQAFLDMGNGNYLFLLLWSGCGKAENLRKRRWASIRKKMHRL